MTGDSNDSTANEVQHRRDSKIVGLIHGRTNELSIRKTGRTIEQMAGSKALT